LTPNARAAAAPNPLDAPVIKTHLFSSGDFMMKQVCLNMN
jgi:hypothetical protein